MIQLGDSSFWLDPGPEGWTLIEVRGKRRQRAAMRLGDHLLPAPRVSVLPDDRKSGMEEKSDLTPS